MSDSSAPTNRPLLPTGYQLWVLAGIALGGSCLFLSTVVGLALLVTGRLNAPREPEVVGVTNPADKRNAFENSDIATLRQAADAGNRYAQNVLAHRYFEGTGIPKDTVEAVRWSRKAAQQGSTPAQYLLGWCYEHGEGVSGKDNVQALSWYQKAAKHHPHAQDAVARLGAGKGVPVYNSFQGAKVGDWATYKMASPNLVGQFEIHTKMTIVESSPVLVRYTKSSQMIGKVPGLGPLGEVYSIDLRKSYTPFNNRNLLDQLAPEVETEVVILSNGEESIVAAGKTYNCEWIKSLKKAGIGLFAGEIYEQYWFSKDVPMTGIVKAETRRGDQVVNVLELTAQAGK